MIGGETDIGSIYGTKPGSCTVHIAIGTDRTSWNVGNSRCIMACKYECEILLRGLLKRY